MTTKKITVSINGSGCVLLVLLVILIAMCCANCTTKPLYQRGPTVTLVLRPRKGHDGKLTNQRCAQRKKYTAECLKFDTLEFDLTDQPTRENLRELKFVCNVRGERYVPCEKSIGLCQLRRNVSGWGPWKTSDVVVNKYLSIKSDYSFLVQADTYCASLYSDVGREMFP